MKSRDYWRKRQEDLQNLILEPSESYVKEIEKGYREALKELESRISLWYQRFAYNNNVDIVTARKMLNKGELAELKWDLQEYIKRAQEGSTWAKELENASARVHISRYQALQLQVRDCIESLYAGRENKLKDILGDVYTESEYHNAYEIYLRTGREIAFDVVDMDKLNRLLAKPWTVDGKNFSGRIWDNKDKLIRTLNQEFTQAFAMGFNPQQLIDRVAKKMDSDRYNAGRLIMTESAYFATKGQIDCYKSLDVEEFEVIGALDSLTCSTCGSIDGKHYPVTAMEAGSTAPPFHPNCRCTTVPYFDDEFTEGEERAARDKDGNTYYTKAKTYEEWKKDNVRGENDARYDKMFYVVEPNAGDAVKPKNIYKELNKSEVGRETIEYIQQGNVNIEINYTDEAPENIRGYQRGNNIVIYAQNIQTVKGISETIVHEVTHAKYDIGGDLKSEVNCFLREILHRNGILTTDDKRNTIKLVKRLYPEYKWKEK